MKSIQQTAGALNFICQALPAGCPFLSSLYRLTRTVHGVKRAAGHHRWLSHEVCKDLEVLHSFLSDKAEDKVKSIPFLARLKIFSDDISLYANTAGGKNLVLGCTFGLQWCQEL